MYITLCFCLDIGLFKNSKINALSKQNCETSNVLAKFQKEKMKLKPKVNTSLSTTNLLIRLVRICNSSFFYVYYSLQFSLINVAILYVHQNAVL